MEAGKCRSCGAPVLWVRNANGNLQILDATPDPKGKVVVREGIAHTMRGDLFEPAVEGTRYTDHHATCPNVARHRRKK